MKKTTFLVTVGFVDYENKESDFNSYGFVYEHQAQDKIKELKEKQIKLYQENGLRYDILDDDKNGFKIECENGEVLEAKIQEEIVLENADLLKESNLVLEYSQALEVLKKYEYHGKRLANAMEKHKISFCDFVPMEIFDQLVKTLHIVYHFDATKRYKEIEKYQNEIYKKMGVL